MKMGTFQIHLLCNFRVVYLEFSIINVQMESMNLNLCESASLISTLYNDLCRSVAEGHDKAENVDRVMDR